MSHSRTPLKTLRQGATETACALLCLAGPSIIANGLSQALLRGEAWMDARNGLRILALLLGYVLWVRWRERRPVQELGLRGATGETGLGLLIGGLMVALGVGAMAWGGAYQVQAVNGPAHALALLPLVLSLAALEEILFRLILLRLMERWLGTGWGLFISSLLFGLAHLGMGPATVASTLLLGLEGGLLFGAAYLLTRRLWLCLGLHIGWNFVQMGIFSADATLALKRMGWLQASIDGPAWLTGGVHGMEASVPAALLCLSVGAALLTLAIRRGQWQARTAHQLATSSGQASPAHAAD